MRGFVAGALALIILGAGSAKAAPRPIVPADINRLHEVTDPQVGPSGEWVAYSVRTTDIDADKTVDHLWMTKWDGSATVRLTSRKGESETHPRFSPDGKWIAFLSSRGDDGDDTQLWLMDRRGGEGERLPGIKGSVDDFAWSPDANKLVLVVTDPDPQASAKKAGKKDGEDAKPHPIVIDRFQFKQDIDGYLGKRRKRLWIYDLATHEMRRLTTGDFDEALPAWSPDGTRIAFTSKRAPDPDRTYDSNLFVASVGDTPAKPVALTRFAGADNDSGWGSYPAWSPDGSHIAYLQGGPVKLFSYGTRHLAIISAGGGDPTILTASLDRNVHDPIWSRDGRNIRFIVEDDEAERIAQVPAAGGAVRDIASGWRVFSHPSANPRGGMAVLLTTPAAPDEVYALGADGTLRQLSHQNDAWLREVAVAPVKRTRMTSKDGTEVHGFIVTPPGIAKPANLPTVLYNHGGPQSQFDAGFNIMWQIFAGHGFAVVSTNPRGSTGRGQDYAAALYADWGGPAVPDALAGVDDAVASGIANPDRLFVGGWSYGAMLTEYIIASDQRFRAAVAGAGIVNVLAGYGTDQYIRDYEMELGTPWTNLDAWLKISYPFYHNDRIVTPTLFMNGEKDFNVPLINSEQMYQALKSRDVPTELVIYPGQFHGFRRPSFLKDRMERWLAWYDRFAAGKPS
ncbi:S9 family peptidase [Stakelama marina]|uniref:S9 family peptidase n=1 Tax=Stakelama marina TaxID=2826939 RepID=A0A8T4IK34_9SPHN|nr:S9 family peptidase [Stakelama marina]MBR0552546.1 S9 family peptidase [Stakelama marina]